MGEACDTDPDKWLKVSGCDPRGPLEMLLMAVIAAHPWTGMTDEKRVETALEVLLGNDRRMGAPVKSENEILLEITWNYFERWLTGQREIPIAPIIKHVLQRRSRDMTGFPATAWRTKAWDQGRCPDRHQQIFQYSGPGHRTVSLRFATANW
jgi:hypothetical protein